MRNWVLSVAVVLALTPVCAAAKDYSADRYDVQLQLNQQGTLDVTETVDFRFEGGPFTYVYRDIAGTETDGIRNVRAWMDGEELPPGRVQISGTSPVKVRWNFGPLSNSTHTFTLHYQATGVLRPSPDAQRLVWRALPGNRSYRIKSSNITLEYPAGVSTPDVSVRKGARLIDTGPGRTVVHLALVKRDAQPVLTAVFPANSFAAPAPEWMTREQRRRDDFSRGARGAAGPAFLLVAVGLFGLLGFRREQPALAAVTFPEGPAIPGPQPPAVAATLIQRHGRAQGILFDLARRGVLRIEESKRGFMGSRHFVVHRTGEQVPLAPHEQAYLDSAFKPGASVVGLTELQSAVSRKWRGVRRAIAAEMRDAGFVDESRSSRRRWAIGAGLAGLAIGVPGLLFGLVGLKSAALAGVAGQALVYGAGILTIAIAYLIVGSNGTRWTDSGTEMAARWRGYANYLRDLSRGRVPAPGPAEFERLLPYAAAFDIAHSLLRRQAKEGHITLPPWFIAQPSADGGGAEVAALIAFTSTGDAGAGGGGAGGGASGGGASGAG